MQLSYLDIEHFYHLPCHVYWKDKMGVYLGSNDYPAIAAGVKNKGTDYVGLTDLDICIEKHARIFRSNDKTVLEKMRSVTVIEEVKHLQHLRGIEYTVLSYKYPVFNEKGKPSSVLGLSFILKKNAIPLELQVPDLEDPLLHFHHKNNPCVDALTPRQMDCLYLLVMGKTAKEIAEALCLSKRTVEHHLNTIKTKYACASRSDLIYKALQMPYIKTRLMALNEPIS